MNLITGAMGFLVPPFWALRTSRGYRGESLSKRMEGLKVLSIVVGESNLVPALISFSKGEATLSALPVIPTLRAFSITGDQISHLRGQTKTQFLALTVGSGPEQGEIILAPNIRRYPNELGFHTTIAHSPSDFVSKPKAGFAYRGLPHPTQPMAIIAMIDPTRDSEFAREAKVAGMTLVRLQLSLLQLANMALADPRLRTDKGGHVLISDQCQALLVTIGPKGNWEGLRYRSMKPERSDAVNFVQNVVKNTVRDLTQPIVLLDTQTSGGVDFAKEMTAYNILRYQVDGLEPGLLANAGLTAA